MSYFYNGVNISNLITSGGGPAVPNYGGFPVSFPPSCNSTGFDKPANFSYTIGGTDVSNLATSYYYQDGTNGTNANIPINIPNTSIPFKSISICCAGGGAGGGGGGSNTPSYGGGDGGDGGDGSYAALLNYPLSNYNSINYKIGNQGNGGSAENKETGPGTPGNDGNNTVVLLNSPNSTYQLIECPGGNVGSGGKQTPGIAKGNTAGSGNTPSSTVNAPGFSYITSVNAPGYTPENFPPQNQKFTNNSGNGGNGGNASANNGSNSGNQGNSGFVLFYFSYQ
jgi:hypothetical protein